MLQINYLIVYVPDTPKFATVHKLGSSLPTGMILHFLFILVEDIALLSHYI